jgi:hypothetical protein
MLISQRVLMHNVGNPRASSARAISPTDRWHAGQNGFLSSVDPLYPARNPPSTVTQVPVVLTRTLRR